MKLRELFSKKNMTVPNALSLTRIILIPIILYFFYIGTELGYKIGFVLFVLAMFTDFLDGYLARKWNQITDLGKVLDPLADKLAIAAASVYLYLERDFPLWLILIIVLKDLLLVFGGLLIIEKKDQVIPSNFYGKMTTIILGMLFIVYLVNFEPLKKILITFSVIFLVLSFGSYARNFFRIFRENSENG